ncbi:sugar kinase [bacterium]|nr:sugar kinase [bacterium]
MSIIVVGSSAFDDIKTPRGSRKRVVGGSCIYFSFAASLKSRVKIVSVVGKDFPHKIVKTLNKKNVSTDGLVVQKGKTFSWGGVYNTFSEDPETKFTKLNVFENFSPEIPDSYPNKAILFLANIDPTLQNSVLDLYPSSRVVGMDTMNFWINSKRKELFKVLKRVDILTINELELRLIAKKNSMKECFNVLLNDFGIRFLIIKRGSSGSMLVTKKTLKWVPSYPFCDVYDPTGAGDSYAGALFSCLDKEKVINEKTITKGMLYASAMSSFTIEKFGIENLVSLSKTKIIARVKILKEISKL